MKKFELSKEEVDMIIGALYDVINSTVYDYSKEIIDEYQTLINKLERIQNAPVSLFTNNNYN